MRSNCDDFMDKVFNGNDIEFAQNLFDDQVASQGDSLAFNLSVTSFVDQLGDKSSGGLTKKQKY